MNSTKYKEIQVLYEYCLKIGINANLEPLRDGYAIRFPNGGDIAQHEGTYGSGAGCVELNIGCPLDFIPVSLRRAKRLVRCYEAKLAYNFIPLD